jgi:WD40 repeat protein
VSSSVRPFSLPSSLHPLFSPCSLAPSGLIQLRSLFSDEKKKDATAPDPTQSASLFASVETSSCLLTIACHPIIPTLVAGGCFSGALCVFDFSNRADVAVTSSSTEGHNHHEPIVSLAWVKAGTRYANDYYVSPPLLPPLRSLPLSPPIRPILQICTLGNDGLVLVWSLDNHLAQPIHSYSLPVRAKELAPGKEASLYGGSSLAFSTYDPTQFFFGTENGGVFRGSLRKDPRWGTPIRPGATTAPAAGSGASAAPSAGTNPVVFTYATHIGPPNALAVCARHRNLFVSAGADGMLVLRNALYVRALLPSLSLPPFPLSLSLSGCSAPERGGGH